MFDRISERILLEVPKVIIVTIPEGFMEKYLRKSMDEFLK